LQWNALASLKVSAIWESFFISARLEIRQAMIRQFDRSMPEVCFAILVALSLVQPTFAVETEEEAYSRVIAERAAKMTQAMKFADAEQKGRVQ